jgi:hypothetical protein
MREKEHGYVTRSYEQVDWVSHADPKANLVTSILDGERPGSDVAWHAPVIDLDMPCELLESSTKGHYHLLIDKPMQWADYKKLLTALLEVGIIEKGWYDSALALKASSVRMPGILKYEMERYSKSLTDLVSDLEDRQ